MDQHIRTPVLTIAAVLFLGMSITALGTSPDGPDRVELRERFGEQQFVPEGGFILSVGQRLPKLVWEHPELVGKVVADPDIPTRWFNERFEEVQSADQPGRYYVYGEAPVPSGPVLRRAMTCCCVMDGVNLPKVAEQWVRLPWTGVGSDTRPQESTTALKWWRTSEQGAVELAALLEGDRLTTPGRRNQWQMEDATRHVRLKRKLMGLENVPTVKATVKPLEGDLAPTLRRAPLEQTDMTRARVQNIESKLDRWYETSREPMAVVIARNGVIVVAKGYGQLHERPVTIETPMALDSAMKPLIGLQLAMYVDRGIVKLDEPIGNFLPEFDTPRDRDLTFRAAHTHVTGIHFPWDLAFSRLFYFHTWHEALIAHCKREWESGERHRYGVAGVILSVRALELLRGRNYWDAMERDLFKSLQIRDVLPGGSGFSAEGMAKVGVVLANRGKYGKWEVISEKTPCAQLKDGASRGD